jgi:hypothetical protein
VSTAQKLLADGQVVVDREVPSEAEAGVGARVTQLTLKLEQFQRRRSQIFSDQTVPWLELFPRRDRDAVTAALTAGTVFFIQDVREGDDLAADDVLVAVAVKVNGEFAAFSCRSDQAACIAACVLRLMRPDTVENPAWFPACPFNPAAKQIAFAMVSGLRSCSNGGSVAETLVAEFRLVFLP